MSAVGGVTLGGQGSSNPIPIVLERNVFWQAAPAYSLGLVCTVSGGASLTYSVQVTADPTPSAGGNWNEHDIITGLTASANSNIAYPVTAVRLKVTSFVSGSVHLGVALWP